MKVLAPCFTTHRSSQVYFLYGRPRSFASEIRKTKFLKKKPLLRGVISICTCLVLLTSLELLRNSLNEVP